MASVFKASYTRTDPKTGKTRRVKYRHWSIKFKNALGKWERRRGYRDKEASLTLARKLEKRAEQERAGIHDPFEDHQATELSQHLTDFKRALVARGNCEDHIARTYARAKSIVDACGFTRIVEIDATAVEDAIATMRERQDNPIGKQTSNYYLGAIKQFARWLHRSRRSPYDPLVHLTGLDTGDTQSRNRRACSDAQFAKLIAAARVGVPDKGLPGADRAALYMLAAFTGFRAQELSSVSAESFDLASDPPTLTVESGYSKRRRRDTQPLRKDLAAFLRDWLSGRSGLLWPGRWFRKAAAMLRVDLKAAGVPYVDDRGRVLDFHALRHTYITSLHKGGAYGKILQTLARHSTAALTARYTHVELNDVAAALGGLPKLDTGPQSPQTSRNLGTA